MAPTTEQLATPTVGAWQRAHSHEGMCEEARHLYAVTFVQEALAAAIHTRIASIQLFLEHGATPDQAMHRLTQLVADYYSKALE